MRIVAAVILIFWALAWMTDDFVYLERLERAEARVQNP